MAAFDSDKLPLVTRIEVGAGLIVTSDQNSDSELVYNITLDSDYVQGIVENALDNIKARLDSDSTVIQTINARLDSDSTVIQTIKTDFDSDSTVLKGTLRFALQVNQRVFDFDSDREVQINAFDSDLTVFRELFDSEIPAIKTRLSTNEARLDSDQTEIAKIRVELDSDTLVMQDLQEQVNTLRTEFDSDVALIRSMLDSDSLKIQANTISIEDLIRRANENDSDHILFRASLDSDELNIQRINQLELRADDNDSDHVVFRTDINALNILVDSERNLAGIIADIDSETGRVEEMRKDLDSETARISAVIGAFDSDQWFIFKIDSLEQNVQTLTGRADVDSDLIQLNRKDIDSDSARLSVALTRLDSDLIVINALADDLDSDLIALKPTFARLDSDSLKLQELDTTLNNLRVEFDSDVALLRNIVDSDTVRIQEHTLRIENLELRADENDSDHILFRTMLDSDNAALQNHGARIDLLEISLDSEEAYTKNRFVAINTRADSESIKVQSLSLTATGDTARLDSDILKMYDLIALQDIKIDRIDDSDYFDSDRVYNSLINNLPAIDSDQLANAITEKTDTMSAKVDTIYETLGIVTGTPPVPRSDDSDYNEITYSQANTYLAGNVRLRWRITNNGGEVRSQILTVAAGSGTNHALRAIQYSVNTDVVAMNYLTKFQIDLDGGVGDKILFTFGKGYENFEFEIEILKATASDKASFNITQ